MTSSPLKPGKMKLKAIILKRQEAAKSRLLPFFLTQKINIRL